MRRDPRCPLADIDRAAMDIVRFTEGMDCNAYFGDALVQAAVERKFVIAGEALDRLHRDHPGVAERIRRLRRIVDFRNFLSRCHDRVEPDRVWTYARRDLPELHRTVQALLAELGPPGERTPTAFRASPGSRTRCRAPSDTIRTETDRVALRTEAQPSPRP